jgi:hypothetical protein
LICYLLLLLAYLAGMSVPLDDAAARYAEVALRIAESGDWTQLALQGDNTFEKPYLLFWLVAVLFEMFGVDAVAFKLPSLLFGILAVYATVRLCALLYNETSGRLAGVILASAFALMLSGNDIRMNTLLAGSVIYATWQLIVFVADTNKRTQRPHLVTGGFGMALGFAAGGMVGVLLPLIAVLFYLVYRLDWKRFFDPFWLVLPLVVVLFTSPVLYVCYTQSGLEGLQSLLWPRDIKFLPVGLTGDAHPVFYFSTFLWALLPWSALALWSLASGVRRLVSDHYWPRARGDAVTLGTIAVTCIALTMSKARLAHYFGALLPFFAIQLAGWLPTRLRHRAYRPWLWRVQFEVFAVLVVGALVLNVWMFELRDWLVGIVASSLLVFGFWLAVRRLPVWFRHPGFRPLLLRAQYAAFVLLAVGVLVICGLLLPLQGEQDWLIAGGVTLLLISGFWFVPLWLPERFHRPNCRPWLLRGQCAICALVATGVFLLYLNYPLHDWQGWQAGLWTVALLVLGFWAIPHWMKCASLVMGSVSMAAVFWLLVNSNIYPQLLEYQAGITLAEVVKRERIDPDSIYYLEGGRCAPSFNIATRRLTPAITLEELGKKKEVVLFVSEVEQDILLDRKDALLIERPEDLGSSPDFQISRLKWAFLDPRTRNTFFPGTDKKILSTWYLLRVRSRVPGQGSEDRNQ